MAPTEILARQHQASPHRLARAPDPALSAARRQHPGARPARGSSTAVATGADALLVGTHALIEDEVAFSDLGLVVVDEQHRFGVAQRQRLRQKAGGAVPTSWP